MLHTHTHTVTCNIQSIVHSTSKNKDICSQLQKREIVSYSSDYNPWAIITIYCMLPVLLLEL